MTISPSDCNRQNIEREIRFMPGAFKTAEHGVQCPMGRVDYKAEDDGYGRIEETRSMSDTIPAA